MSDGNTTSNIQEEQTSEKSRVILEHMAEKIRHSLPVHIFAVAARNAKNRFFIPSKVNDFAGIPCEFVMMDSGCNSFLLPFKAEAMMFQERRFIWSIQASHGTGALKSPTLVIKRNDGAALGQLSLAGSAPLMKLKRLRFHLGSESVQVVLDGNNGKLSEQCLQKLRDFRTSMGQAVSPERRNVLLGQAYLREVLSMQLGDIMIMGDKKQSPTHSDYDHIYDLLTTLREGLPEFDDLEDEDHDGDADEECQEEIEDIDEPTDGYLDSDMEGEIECIDEPGDEYLDCDMEGEIEDIDEPTDEYLDRDMD